MASKRESKWERAVRAVGPKGTLPVEKPDWISRALARAGVLPPEEADAAIAGGRVSLAGRVVREPLTLWRPADEVRLDGRRVSLAAPTIVLAFHKPPGCVVSTRDETGKPTVFDLLRAGLTPDLRRYGWHAVGRLDRDTTGLLLFSNDERLVGHATRPETHLPKRYVAQVQGAPDEARLEPLRQGLALDDGPTRPARARVRASGEVELTITEGRNHQVKRMLGAVGLPVRRLHREAIGKLVLDVSEGQWRRLSESEISEGLGFTASAGSPPSTRPGR
jgi:23S rRNA pseudouridine2605 synthase/16S rRNA pseudouridine516 synthase